MRDCSVFLAALGVCACVGMQASALAAEPTADNPNGCQIIERHGGAPGNGSVSSGVTAGGGHVSSYSSAGGASITVHSGNGTSGAAAGTSGNGSSTVVTTSDGHCVIYVNPGEKQKESKK